ncbi:MAG: hypothetical protein HOH33_00610, partial [Verrucomicrobia bacterium]|nr:hypothetical protein [Verrucomicrobiota bacterium]
LLIPFFEAGGRFTIDDTHYVQQGDQLIPAAETPFAQDSVFGYKHSNLKAWVEEKTQGQIQSNDVCSLSLDRIRTQGPEGVTQFLMELKQGSVCIVNAAEASDLNVLVAACKQANLKGRRFLFRTGAQWISAWLGQSPHPVANHHALSEKNSAGGLIVVGSYVPMTTRQLTQLRRQPKLFEIECPVSDLLDPTKGHDRLRSIIDCMNRALNNHQNVVVFTSRDLVTQGSNEGDLNVGKQISNALVHIVKSLSVQPRYLIAKGGITSSDVATQALGVKRAMVLGQAHPGIPVWELGSETNYPGMHYIVFPGNVGNDQTLLEIYQKFNP